MAPGCSTEVDPPTVYTPAERALLLGVAGDSIRHGLAGEGCLTPDPETFPESLREARASFVTLHLAGELRGCIGVLEPCRPLVADVAHNAWAAAFTDPRFPPLAPQEFAGLQIHISVLSHPEPVVCGGEAELLARLRPGVDGLILREGRLRGTFLPSVWEQLPEPRQFLRHLKRKAGLPEDYWSPTLMVARYTTESFG